MSEGWETSVLLLNYARSLLLMCLRIASGSRRSIDSSRMRRSEFRWLERLSRRRSRVQAPVAPANSCRLRHSGPGELLCCRKAKTSRLLTRTKPLVRRTLRVGRLALQVAKLDRISLRVVQAGEPAVGIGLRVNLDRDSSGSQLGCHFVEIPDSEIQHPDFDKVIQSDESVCLAPSDAHPPAAQLCQDSAVRNDLTQV